MDFFFIEKDLENVSIKRPIWSDLSLEKGRHVKECLVVIGPLKLLHFIYFFSGKPVDLANLMNPTGKDFDANESAVLALIMERSK